MNREAIAAEAGPVVAEALIDMERRIKRAGDVATRLDVQANSRLPMDTVYSDISRPEARSLSPGTRIWNSDDSAPNWSDGTNWRDASGGLT